MKIKIDTVLAVTLPARAEHMVFMLLVTLVMLIPNKAESITQSAPVQRAQTTLDTSRYIPQKAAFRGALPTDIRYARYIASTPEGTQVKGKPRVPVYSMFPNKYLTPASTGAYKKRDPMQIETSLTRYPWLKTVGTIEDMRMVLKRNPGDVNARDDLGRNGLMIAVDKCDIERAKLLIAYKIDVNALSIDEQRSTALHMLVRKSRLVPEDVNMMKLLIKAGAKVNALDSMGRTPLHWLGGVGDPAIRTYFLDVLMNNGADINIQDYNGQTMVYTTINYLWRDTDWFKILFEVYGSKIDGKIRDKINYSPIDFARENGFMTVVKFLCTTGKWPCRPTDKMGYRMPTGTR